MRRGIPRPPTNLWPASGAWPRTKNASASPNTKDDDKVQVIEPVKPVRVSVVVKRTPPTIDGQAVRMPPGDEWVAAYR
jgi:hypothetical protein